MTSRLPTSPATLCSLLLCTVPVLGHMEMSWPYPFRSKFNPDNVAANIDYSMTSPLSPDGSDFPCKGYQNDRPVEIVTTYAAGSTYNITLAGSAPHKGGSCQISVSYDNGATFRVIKSMIGGCPLKSTYDFDVPSYAPEGRAVLSWTWQNGMGNREFYQNCAAVNIVASSQRRRRRQEIQSFEHLPLIWKANLQGINDCTTTEGEDPVYPSPGPQVEYGNGYSSSSTSSPRTCDAVTPFGQTFMDIGDSTLAAPPDSSEPDASDDSPAATWAASEATPTKYGGSGSDDSMTESWNYGPGGHHNGHGSNDDSDGNHDRGGDGRPELVHKLGSGDDAGRRPYKAAAPTDVPRGPRVAADTPSNVNVTADCENTVVYPSATIPPDTSSIPSTMATSVRASATDARHPVPTSRPRYATGSIESVNAQYLPCVPGTFLCTSKTTFLTCTYNDGTVESDETWVYSRRYERTVAAGMECLPTLAPYQSSTHQYGQQHGVKTGSYRNDGYM